MRRKYYYLILLFIYMPLRAQEANIDENTSKEEIKKQSQISPNNTVSSDKDSVVIKSVDNMRYSETIDESGYTQATLTGNVHVIYEQYKIWSDQIVIRFKNDQAEILVASGNIYLEHGESKQKTVAQKVFIYLKEKNIIVMDSLNVQDGMILKTGSLKSGKDSLITVTNINLTTSTYLYPHYVVFGKKGWVDKNNDFLLYGSHIKIGQEPLFYLPLFFNISYGTGIISSLTYNYYLGFISNNTFKKQTETYKEVFMFDYYQKLGQYIGNTYSRNDIGDLVTHIGLAYDKHILFKDGQISNIFEQIPGEGLSAGRSFRYNFLLDYKKDLIKSEDPDGFSLTFKGTYKEMSDPFFARQFEEARKEKFNLKDLLFPSNDDDILTRIDNSSSLEEVGRLVDTTFAYSFLGFTGEIRQNIEFILSPKRSNQTINTFSASYYQNTLSTISLPEITLNKNFKIYTLEKEFEQGKKLNMPFNLYLNSTFGNNRDYESSGLISSEMKTSHSLNLTMPINYIISDKFIMDLALSTRYQLDYGGYGAYNNSKVSSYYKSLSHNIALDYSPSLTWKFVENTVSTKWMTNLKTTYYSKDQNTEDADENQILNDYSNTYATINQTMGETVTTAWVSKNPFFQGSLIAEYNYIMSDKAGEILPTAQRVNSKRHVFSSSLNIFKSTLKVSSYNQKGNTIAKDLEQGALNLNLSSTLIPYITVGNNYVFNRYENRASNNNFNVALVIPLRINVSDWLWFNSVNVEFSWSKNYFDYMQDYLTYRFYLDFNITENWKFNLSLNGRNYQLYRYNSGLANGRYVNFWVDLFKSLAFWSSELRQQSSFKMENFAFSVAHDLDEWLLKASAEFAPKLLRTGTYYFESQFSIEVILKDFDSLSAPPITQGNRNMYT